MVDIPLKQLSGGFTLPAYGLGTWGMGGDMEPDYSHDAQHIEAIQSALSRGVTHIDTAEMYGNGHTEELVGQAIAGQDRGSLRITTKAFAGLAGGYDGVMRACEASLERLGTDYVDLYLLHRSPPHDTAGVMRAFDELVAQGMVRHIGASNMTVNRFRETQAMTGNKLVCNQLHYSLECREIVDRGVLQYSQDNDVLVTAWGPLSKGSLQMTGVLHEIAEKYGKTPYQVALNWLIAQDNVITIPKTSSLQHLDENLGALGWRLDEADWQRLSDEFPEQQLVSNRVPLDYDAEIPA